MKSEYADNCYRIDAENTSEKMPRLMRWGIFFLGLPHKGAEKMKKQRKLNGGAYIKKDLATLEKARKSKALERHLECSIPSEVYEKIEEIINQ